MKANNFVLIVTILLGTLFILSLIQVTGEATAISNRAEAQITTTPVFPSPGLAQYIIKPSKLLLEVGDTIDVQVILRPYEGCEFGSSGFHSFISGDDNWNETDHLIRITPTTRDRVVNNSLWRAEKLGSARLIAFSVGEGICQTDPNIPAPFFNATASGSSSKIYIVETIVESYLPIVAHPKQ